MISIFVIIVNIIIIIIIQFIISFYCSCICRVLFCPVRQNNQVKRINAKIMLYVEWVDTAISQEQEEEKVVRWLKKRWANGMQTTKEVQV